MVDFDNLNVKEDIKNILKQFQVDFVFQPIFSRDKELVAHEALMRPLGTNILDYIAEMRAANRLHDLELVSFFGATMEYRKRGYDTMLCINSFPSECFTVEEAKAYSDCFKPIKDKLVIEILEYTEGERWQRRTKEAHTKVYDGISFAIDDFGTGNNDILTVETYNPYIVKLDRSLIENIDADAGKQCNVKNHIAFLHSKGIAVLAEGVETEEEYNYLHSIGIDFFQGYFLAKPA